MIECDFCLEFGASNDENRHNVLFHRLFPHLPSRVILSSDNFVVIPSLGQIVEGYLLIVTKQHLPSMGHVSLGLEGELREVIKKVFIALAEVYGNEVLFFEHGPLNACRTGASCINHAHLHIVPLPNARKLVQIAAKALGERLRNLDYLFEARRMIQNQKPYLYVGVGDGFSETSLMREATNLPSQYMRRLIAEFIGKPYMWDWAVYVGEDSLISTLSKLSSWFREKKI